MQTEDLDCEHEKTSLPKVIDLRLTHSTAFRAVEEDSEKSLVRRPIRHVGELRLSG